MSKQSFGSSVMNSDVCLKKRQERIINTTKGKKCETKRLSKALLLTFFEFTESLISLN